MLVPTVVVDPSLLAFPNCLKTADAISEALDCVMTIAKEARERRYFRIVLPKDADALLESMNCFPSFENVREVLCAEALDRVYSPDDVCRQFAGLLDTLERYETISSDWPVVVLNTCSPPLELEYEDGHYRNSFRSTIETLAEAALHDERNAALFRGVLAVPGIEVCVAEAVVTRAHGNLEVEKSMSVVVVGALNSFFKSLQPYDVWITSETEQSLYFSIQLGLWKHLLQDKPDFRFSDLPSFNIGKCFLPSLRLHKGLVRSSTASTVFETVVRLLAGNPKYPEKEFRGDDGEQRVRSDGALAWRTHVSKRHEAIRLMYWRHRDGTVELANIGNKHEERIE